VEKIISVDSGRSGVKSCYYDGKYILSIFSAKHGQLSLNKLANMPVMAFTSQDVLKENNLQLGDIITSIDGSDPYIMGKTTDLFLPPDEVVYCTEDSVYIEYAKNYVLTMLGKLAKDKEELTVGVNLTFSSFDKFKDIVKEQLKGTHNIKFYNPKGKIITEKTFNVSKITLLHQGWSSLVYRYYNEDGTTNPLYARDGLTLDIGRKSTDVLFSRKLTPVKSVSYDLGMESVFSHISKALFSEHGIKITTMDIESNIMNKDKLYDKKGNEVEVTKYLKEAIILIAGKLRNDIMSDYADYNFQFILLTGGGSFFFKDVLEKIFPRIEVLDNPVFSNALGLTKFIVCNS
jgi:hypothetical protein